MVNTPVKSFNEVIQTLEQRNQCSRSLKKQLQFTYKNLLKNQFSDEQITQITLEGRTYLDITFKRIPEALNYLESSSDLSKTLKAAKLEDLSSNPDLEAIASLLGKLILKLENLQTDFNTLSSPLIASSVEVARLKQIHSQILRSSYTKPKTQRFSSELFCGILVSVLCCFFSSFNLSMLQLTLDFKDCGILLVLSVLVYYLLSVCPNLKLTFIVSVTTILLGNLMLASKSLWGVGGILVPNFVSKQLIGGHVDSKVRTRYFTACVAANYIGISCGYFVGKAFHGPEEKTEVEAWSFASIWVILLVFGSFLFNWPEEKKPSVSSQSPTLKLLVALTFMLQVLIQQTFLGSTDKGFSAFIGIFYLVVAPVHILVSLFSHHLSEMSFVVTSKIFCGVGCLMVIMNWCLLGYLLIVLGVNIGTGASFSLLSRFLGSRKIGLYSSLIEVSSFILGQLTEVVFHKFVFGVLCLTLVSDCMFYTNLNRKLS